MNSSLMNHCEQSKWTSVSMFQIIIIPKRHFSEIWNFFSYRHPHKQGKTQVKHNYYPSGAPKHDLLSQIELKFKCLLQISNIIPFTCRCHNFENFSTLTSGYRGNFNKWSPLHFSVKLISSKNHIFFTFWMLGSWPFC